MGNVLSSASTGGRTTNYVTSESDTMDDTSVSRESDSSEEYHDTIDEGEARSRAKEEELEEFRRELNIKREQRKVILSRHRNEKKELEKALETEKKAKLEAHENNKQLRELLLKNNLEIPENLQSSKEDSSLVDTIVEMQEEFEKLKENNNQLRRGLTESNSSLQNAYSDIADLTGQNREAIKQIQALKEVVTVSKTMISLREQQLNELKDKLNEIEQSLADRETNMLSANLRQEYERQLQNIRTLRGLYEERARLAEVTRQSLIRELEEQKILKQAELNKCIELQSKVEELEARVDDLQEIIENKNNQISSCQEETRGLNAEMSAVNKLFSQVLLGYQNKQGLDKLVHRLEENHGLLTHMAERENGSEASSALPKLLLELINQVDEGEENQSQAFDEESNTQEKLKEQSETQNTSAEEIVQNLPKVWRVLMELLSHQSTTDDNPTEKVTTCYKSVDTKSGPVLVPSVSQTYIRLKDLIIEKLGLVKEVNRMKQLNGHLETRLEEQERRLCLVTTELSKTWHVVGRLRRHHHQLHTHEKILKYELQQKRKLLNELKEELEYCREKWDQAREKNNQSEKDWKKLRAEFSSRKSKSSTSFNNSAESGYSDEKPSDESSESNDESECITSPLIRSKKKVKKSFETILDSSTEINLAAEREDPVSDMLDVADLPLDTQEGDDNNDISSSCNSESFLKSERVCEETEDEVGDITNDSCLEDSCQSSVAERCQDSNVPSIELKSRKEDFNIHTASSSTLSGAVVIDPAAILNSIRQQNERLANKDKKLESLEKSGLALLKQTQVTAKISEQINSTLDHLLNRPTTGRPILENGNGTKISSKITEFHTNIESENRENNLKTSIPNEDKLAYSSEPTSEASCLEQNKITIASIDSVAILTSVREQNEIISSNDNECDTALHIINKTPINGEQVNTTLDLLLKQPALGIQSCNDGCENESVSTVDLNPSKDNKTNENLQVIQSKLEDVITLPIIQDTNPIPEASCSDQDSATALAVDYTPLLESIKKQDERLAKKDERLQEIETGCSKIVKDISNTLNTGERIIEKLDSLHNKNKARKSDKLENATVTVDDDKEGSPASSGSSEPSTSIEMDHEARFAARDLRLKRLEEQTKSLVNKVNKTTTKGVKIHYKLEELHNIYGSESPRAGTPSEESEDRSQNNDDEIDEAQEQ